MTPPLRAQVEQFIVQARCQHPNRTGGNDYILCPDCYLVWDYRRETADARLVSDISALLTEGSAEPSIGTETIKRFRF